MNPGYAIFFAILSATPSLIVITYWLGVFQKKPSGKGLLMIYLLSALAFFLLFLLASTQFLTVFCITAAAFVLLTLIVSRFIG